MGFGLRTISSTHLVIEISTPWELIVNIHPLSSLLMALLRRRMMPPPPLSPLIPFWSSCYFGSLVVWGFTVTLPSLLRPCFAASLSICTVGNPFLSPMSLSRSQVIVEVVALVALLPGIALSSCITVPYGGHCRKVVISFSSSLPCTSTWLGTPLPPLTRSSSHGSVTASQPPLLSSVALTSGHHSPRLL